MTERLAVTNTMRAMLTERDVRDRIAIPIDCDIATSGMLVGVSQLVSAGCLQYVTRTTQPMMLGTNMLRWLNVDVYQLTYPGVLLCREHGIERRVIDVEMTEDVRAVLAHRSVKNKIAMPAERHLCPPHWVAVLATLQHEGFIEFMERALIRHIVNAKTGEPLLADVYQLTPKGIFFCDEHGIEQR